MRLVSPENLEKPSVYIPHHPVFRADSATSRLRVVFNASCATSDGTSLNEHLHCGPKLQTELPAVIMAWRQYRFVYSADIAKMYRQILVDERDVDHQRILWSTPGSSTPDEYQLLTVTYGMICAPYLALRVIQQLENDEGLRFPMAASVLRDNIYVDDVLFGADDIPLLHQTRLQLVGLLRCGGFELRKWASNSPALLADIDESDHGLSCSKSLQEDESLKVLGIAWSSAQDAFLIKISLVNSVPRSKREILSAIARLYDPLGWVTPAVVTAKIFMQHLWRAALNWDDALPDSLSQRWVEIYSRLRHLNGLALPRWIGSGHDIFRVELHGFADAPNLAYAAVVYAKVISCYGESTISLLSAKSKVVPLKPLSVPRLELSAAVLLARLLRFLRFSSPFQRCECVCWTDSSIVLAWISQHPSKWKTFVANRVAEIQTLLPSVAWRHVPTLDNPADCASRGLFGDELSSHPLWWSGPAWLRESAETWPSSDPRVPADAPLEKATIHLAFSKTEDLSLESRFSSWMRLIRVTAYLLRFIQRCRRSKAAPTPGNLAPDSFLTAEECHSARTTVVKYIQSRLFPDEIQALRKKSRIPSRSSLLSLCPFLGGEGVLRIGGRLRNAPLSFARRHPFVLSSHPLVRLIIRHTHLKMLHAGLQLTLQTLRQEFWIVRARSLIRSVLHQCVICARERAVSPTQIMGDLPAARVSPLSRSFVHCGVDYAGPFHVRSSSGRGIKSHKSYVSLFICMATRAIHLELVSDYSSSAFLAAFTRFCSRRGLPHAMYSDNGTTFVGADRELASAFKAALKDPHFQTHIASDRISWHFLPPSAPHFGGLWEAGVRSMKFHLRRVLGSLTLTYEEFLTLLNRIETCLNSRPISPLSDVFDDYEVLTPGHFLIGSSLAQPPEPSVLHLNENRLSRWQLVQHVTERFWRLWTDDYLNTVQQRKKWCTPQPSVSMGQMVWIKNPLLPPCKWEIGQVIDTHPGLDGLVRVVTVKTAHSELKRPIVKICPLPIETADCAETESDRDHS